METRHGHGRRTRLDHPADDIDDHVEEELIPGRTRRRGKQKVVYNLKLLRDQAAEKERRKRMNKMGDKLEDQYGACRVICIFPLK
jgi:hypothetical protein